MSASSVLLVAATIIAVEGGTATIDAGRGQHLEPGDRGQAFYELVVDGIAKRIEVGPVEVVSAVAGTATISSESGTPLRPGYSVEFRLPVPIGPDPSEQEPVPSTAPSDVEEGLAPSTAPSDVEEEPVPSTAPSDVEEGLAPSTAPSDVEEGLAPSLDAPAVPSRDVVYVSSGTYAVGLDPSGAEFFNQTPSHQVRLSGFSIDRLPEGEGRPTGLTFTQALARCEELGLRLPTEQEWEVAARVPGFVVQPGLFEWTASWYQAYPGNTRGEEEYGESSRVLRGVSDWSDESLYTRRFMRPDQSHAQVGFRCVKDSD